MRQLLLYAFYMPSPAQLKYVVMSTLLIIASINITRTTLEIIDSSKRLENKQKEVMQLKEEKSSLLEELSYKTSLEFIDKEVRNKLNMVKPNEEVYIKPDLTSQPRVLGLSTVNTPKEGVVNTTNYFKAWLSLLF